MVQYYFPVVLVVSTNVLYHICAKAMPSQMNSFVGLLVTYLVAAVLSTIMFFATSPSKDLFVQMKEVNWAPFLLGLSIVCLEFGYILLYRVGWNVSVGSLVCNIALAIALIAVGMLFYKEQLTMNHVIGIVLCIGGLIFINK